MYITGPNKKVTRLSNDGNPDVTPKPTSSSSSSSSSSFSLSSVPVWVWIIIAFLVAAGVGYTIYRKK